MVGIAIAVVSTLRIAILRGVKIAPIDPRRVRIIPAPPPITRFVARKLRISTVLVVIVIA
ncbi:hypothetical protein D3C85_1851380 [compost metagenome]